MTSPLVPDANEDYWIGLARGEQLPLADLSRLNEPREPVRQPYVRFFAAGVPAPKGNHRAFVHGGRARVTEHATKGLTVWLHALSDEARVAMKDQPPMEGPLALSATFWLPKPASAPKRKRTWPIKKPDWDKLARGFDALTGVVWRDDAQVVRATIEKRWAEENNGISGVTVEVREVRA
jgi:crossover junction endodeoxyribonuclease RusA